MKFLTLAALPLAYADFDAIQESMASLIANISSPQQRLFTGSSLAAVNQLNGYGCWCYFFDDFGRGKGPPVDEMDAFCKTLHDGYECAIRDTEDEGEECIPYEIGYTAAVGGTIDNLLTKCTDVNPGDNCAIRACAVEGLFVENSFALALSGAAVDYASFGHSNGFDPSVSCPTKKGTGPPQKSCCGTYPSRYPFKTLDGGRECCGSRTFNTAVLNCCNDFTVKANC